MAVDEVRSWIDSPAFTSLERFNGKVLVAYGEHDDVVPEGVQQRYKQICTQKSGRVVMLRDGAHRLLSPQTEAQQRALVELAKSAVSFLKPSRQGVNHHLIRPG